MQSWRQFYNSRLLMRKVMKGPKVWVFFSWKLLIISSKLNKTLDKHVGDLASANGSKPGGNFNLTLLNLNFHLSLSHGVSKMNSELERFHWFLCPEAGMKSEGISSKLQNVAAGFILVASTEGRLAHDHFIPKSCLSQTCYVWLL